jgi:hypothetical protein
MRLDSWAVLLVEGEYFLTVSLETAFITDKPLAFLLEARHQ